MEKEGMFNDHENNVKDIVHEMNGKIDKITISVRGIIKQRDDAINRIYELEKIIDSLIDEKNELFNKVFSLQDEINNKEKYGGFRNI